MTGRLITYDSETAISCNSTGNGSNVFALTVNAPGTEKITTFLPFHSLVEILIANIKRSGTNQISVQIPPLTYGHHRQADNVNWVSEYVGLYNPKNWYRDPCLHDCQVPGSKEYK
jgi:hypothetical protein